MVEHDRLGSPPGCVFSRRIGEGFASGTVAGASRPGRLQWWATGRRKASRPHGFQTCQLLRGGARLGRLSRASRRRMAVSPTPSSAASSATDLPQAFTCRSAFIGAGLRRGAGVGVPASPCEVLPDQGASLDTDALRPIPGTRHVGGDERRLCRGQGNAAVTRRCLHTLFRGNERLEA